MKNITAPGAGQSQPMLTPDTETTPTDHFPLHTVKEALDTCRGALILANCSISEFAFERHLYDQAITVLGDDDAAARALLRSLIEMTAAAMLELAPWRPPSRRMARLVIYMSHAANPDEGQLVQLAARAKRLVEGDRYWPPHGNPLAWLDSAAALAACWALFTGQPDDNDFDAYDRMHSLAHELAS